MIHDWVFSFLTVDKKGSDWTGSVLNSVFAGIQQCLISFLCCGSDPENLDLSLTIEP